VRVLCFLGYTKDMQHIGKTIGFLAVFLLLIIVFFAVVSQGKVSPEQRKLGQDSLQLEFAKTEQARAKGLSGRTSLPPNHGLLFVFPEKGYPEFWMKDMLFSIDILWLNDEGIVVGSLENVSPNTYPTKYKPPVPVRYALELAAGEASRKSFFVGTRVPLTGNWRK
jgi:uncharacterized protein